MEVFRKEDIMNRLLLIVLILGLTLLPIGCGQDIIRNYMDETLGAYVADYRIVVASDPGLGFFGRYAVVTAVYDPQTQGVSFLWNLNEVEEEIPAEGYMVYAAHDAISVVGSFQKRTGDETGFSVEIWRGGELIQQDETTDPWGMVMVGGIG